MATKHTLAALSIVFCSMSFAAEFSGKGTLELVDGTKAECEILFKHPNCDRLIIRSLKHSTVQSFDLQLVRSIRIGGRSTSFASRRSLKPDEKKELEINRLWGDEATPKQIGRYAKERWSRKPLIVWANPGKSGDAMKPSSWLDERGKPLTEKPFMPIPGKKKNRRTGSIEGKFDGDVLLPAADTQYKALQPGHRDHCTAQYLRHLTIERNASYNVRYTVLGNLWIKNGADIGSGTQTGGMGSREANKHTFIRFCGRRWPKKKGAKKGESEFCAISHWVRIDTGERGSLEIIGQSGGPGDRITLNKGTLVVSEDSHFGNGPRASFYTGKGTTTILLDGASVGCLDKVLRGRGGTYGIAGTLMFGTPQHPLTRDLRFEGALFNKEDMNPKASPGQRTKGASFVLGKTGRMVVHSRDPRKARVIFCPRPDDAKYSSYAVGKRAGGRVMPTGIAAVFQGETDFNGVVFDGFHRGGIMVDPAARRRWRNVSFGESNKAPSRELFKSLN